MVAPHAHVYRKILREVAKASIKPRSARNKDVALSFRGFFAESERFGNAPSFEHDMENVLTFMRSQREYKALLERYNPLIDLTAEERIEATARRVGLNMPKTPESQNE